jgi:hypothetical protein
MRTLSFSFGAIHHLSTRYRLDRGKKENYPLLFQIEILLGRLVAKDASSVPPRRSLGAVRADTNLVSLNLL